MGKILKDQQGNGEYKDFIQGLQQMYTGTKKWGTVRLIVKRSKFEYQISFSYLLFRVHRKQ